MSEVALHPGAASLADWCAIYRGSGVRLDAHCWDGVRAGAESVARIVARGAPVYGINTGFGKLASVRIEAHDLETLQRNIVLSHAAGVGAAIPWAVTRLALAALFEADVLFRSALATGALATDAVRGSDTPFDARIHGLRRHPGQIESARALRSLLEGSAVRASHRLADERVQDPYCLRCQPQVMGACLDVLRGAAGTLLTEANAVSDNPLIFSKTDEALSGGNFHAEPVAFAADIIALAICEIGSLAERRVAMLVDPALSGLPAFLTPRPGLNSGLMMAQVTAAALVAENKQLSHPASVDSIPTSANQEDHVSMAAHGSRRLLPMAQNAMAVVGIELLCAAQGCDFGQAVEIALPAIATN